MQQVEFPIRIHHIPVKVLLELLNTGSSHVPAAEDVLAVKQICITSGLSSMLECSYNIIQHWRMLCSDVRPKIIIRGHGRRQGFLVNRYFLVPNFPSYHVACVYTLHKRTQYSCIQRWRKVSLQSSFILFYVIRTASLAKVLVAKLVERAIRHVPYHGYK